MNNQNEETFFYNLLLNYSRLNILLKLSKKFYYSPFKYYLLRRLCEVFVNIWTIISAFDDSQTSQLAVYMSLIQILTFLIFEIIIYNIEFKVENVEKDINIFNVYNI